MTSRPPANDRTLERCLLAVQTGEVEAWNPLLAHLERRVYPFVYRLLGDPGRAADVCQQTLERVYERISTLQSNLLLVPWTLAIARRLAWRQLSRTQRRAEVERRIEAPRESSSEPSPIDLLLREETIERVRAAVDALEVEHREVIHLYYIEDLPVRGVAAVVGRPEGTIKWMLSRARQRLEELLREEGARDG